MALGRREVADDIFLGDTDDVINSLGDMAVTTRRKKRKGNKRIFKSRRSNKRKYRRSSPKRRSGKIRHTKRGQPYIIQSDGRARFIKRR